MDICLSCCALGYVIVVVHKFQFQLDSLAFSFTFRFILSSACCIHLYSVQINHNLAAIRLLHSLVAFRYCKFRLLHSDFMLLLYHVLHIVAAVSSDCSCCCYLETI
ncbi:hypothetical protein HanXRQr2_Chr15g0710311 [Helianthus annuus]|uniref:Uncharacterized protein n=1 Tax=Helianthus annuus TaxID=4232 RepID=A0A9K3E2V4_HELAN|nr:hypothetical protein HanXRQr2_Chr15g0710311 [Helianthus annuus]